MSDPVALDTALIASMRTNLNQSVAELSEEQPLMLVFLRHFGCNFCREGLALISRQRKEIEARGTIVVFVHMSDKKTADKYFSKYQLDGIQHISDPEFNFYRAFGLLKGTLNELYGFRTWFTGFQTFSAHGSELGKALGDAFQMPGVFVIHRNAIISSFIYANVAQQPDFIELASCCS